MFTLDQIKAAHGKVKSGADFPEYVQDLIVLGVEKYNTYVSDSHTEYFGKNDYQVKSAPKYAALVVAESGDKEKFHKRLKIHQQGQTDYATFCKDAAESGVEKWTVDMKKMTCVYYDKAGNKIFSEAIPSY
jgi:uncharacterized protein YbcV (DUF1398 family)